MSSRGKDDQAGKGRRLPCRTRKVLREFCQAARWRAFGREALHVNMYGYADGDLSPPFSLSPSLPPCVRAHVGREQKLQPSPFCLPTPEAGRIQPAKKGAPPSEPGREKRQNSRCAVSYIRRLLSSLVTPS